MIKPQTQRQLRLRLRALIRQAVCGMAVGVLTFLGSLSLAQDSAAQTMPMAMVEPMPAAASDGSFGDEYSNIYDPIEGINRPIFMFNRQVDNILLKPVARVYRSAVPDPVQDSVRNFVDNLEMPLSAVNSLLQGDLENTGKALTRFVVNSTFGLAGLFDVAGYEGVEAREEDFGQTLAVWGLPEGPYLMLPLLGPGTTLDTVGRVGDYFLDPLDLAYDEYDWDGLRIAAPALDIIDQRARILPQTDTLERTSVDYYASVRSLYYQRRRDEVMNYTRGQVPPPSPGSQDDLFGDSLDDFE